MALSLSQGAAVAAALVSEAVGEGFGGVVVAPSDDLPLALAPLLNAFERFVSAGGPNNLDVFISSFYGGDSSGSSACEPRGLSSRQEKKAKEVFEKLSLQQQKMVRSAAEPLLYQVVILLLFNFHNFHISE